MAIGLHTDLVVISCMAVYQSSVTHEGFQMIMFFEPGCSKMFLIQSHFIVETFDTTMLQVLCLLCVSYA